MLEILFEEKNLKGLILQSSACLSSFLFSKENSLVIDIGGHNTYISSVYDGFQIHEKSRFERFGGENLTYSLDSYLMDTKKSFFDFSFFKKNKLNENKLSNFSRLEIIRDIKHSTFKIPMYGIEKLEYNSIVDNLIYELPDKQNLVLGKETLSISDKLFGCEEFKGVHTIVNEVIKNIDPDYKSEIMSNIIITGGCTSTKGFIERLQKELFEDLCNYKSKFFYLDRQIDRRLTAWLNGSVIGSMKTFSDLMMTDLEYKEHGLSLIDRKC